MRDLRSGHHLRSSQLANPIRRFLGLTRSVISLVLDTATSGKRVINNHLFEFHSTIPDELN